MRDHFRHSVSSLYASTDATAAKPDAGVYGDDEYDEFKDEKTSRWLNWFNGAPGILLGTAVALGLFALVEAVPSLKATLATYIVGKNTYYIGVLYFRAMTCVGVPLAFTSIALSVAAIVHAPKMVFVRVKMVWLIFVSTLLATIQGMVWIWFFRDEIEGSEFVYREGLLTILCPNSTKLVLPNGPAGTLTCMDAPSTAATAFLIGDDIFKIMSKISRYTHYRSNSSQVVHLISDFAPNNVFNALFNNDVVAIVAFAVAFGVATGMLSRSESGNIVMKVLREFNLLLQTMSGYVAASTPVAIIPLILAPLLAGTHTMNLDMLRLAYYLIAYAGVSLLHVGVVLPLILVLHARGNPYMYFWRLKDAATYALGCSSSLKALPVTMRCVDREVSNPGIARFSLSVGTILNKNGAAIYLSMAFMWIFVNGGLSKELTGTTVGVMVVCSLVGSTAVAPIRTGGVGIVVCLYTFVTGLPIPFAFAFLLVGEFLIDPIATITNIAGNVVVAYVIAQKERKVDLFVDARP
ncbi:dicarboxylate/amino acid:cation (Na or H) symporter (DAACS) family protein [Achlya hypogyna]|uniref:Amino acid transporter n=1 Tax=Achlya hypogyna TaxID=1202772 RepID=A0A1V9Z6E9_ACHHY|nr:dicarboxylate/amino acid:cation (Na or H) symporter (DAACS) family protein [Achlya hypogyna]